MSSLPLLLFSLVVVLLVGGQVLQVSRAKNAIRRAVAAKGEEVLDIRTRYDFVFGVFKYTVRMRAPDGWETTDVCRVSWVFGVIWAHDDAWWKWLLP